MSKKTAIGSTAAIIGGLGIGALAMYLLDPKQGEKRRGTIVSSAANAASSTKNAAGATLEQAKNVSKSAAGRAAHYARDLADRVIDEVETRAHHLAAGASHLAGETAHEAVAAGAKVGDRASAAWSALLGRKDEGQETLENLRTELSNRVKHAAGVEDAHPVAEFTGHTLGTFGFLVVGAGSMYFLDPARGRARRAWLEDKVVAIVRRTGKRARGLGRHLGNKSQGYYAQASHAVPETWKPSFMREDSNGGVQSSAGSTVQSQS
jgi:gas vesicle protein